MTVLSPAAKTIAMARFPVQGRYSFISFLLDFAEWDADLLWVLARLGRLRNGTEFAELFAEIIVLSQSKSRWCMHPEARSILQRHCETMVHAWDTELVHSANDPEPALEYLSDALKCFAKATHIR